jgi:hypothetical protein
MTYTQRMIDTVKEINKALPSFVEYVIRKNKGKYTISAYVKKNGALDENEIIEMGVGFRYGAIPKFIERVNREFHSKVSDTPSSSFIGMIKGQLHSDLSGNNFRWVREFCDTPKNMLDDLLKFRNRVVEEGEFTTSDEWLCAKGAFNLPVEHLPIEKQIEKNDFAYNRNKDDIQSCINTISAMTKKLDELTKQQSSIIENGLKLKMEKQ